MSHCDKGHKLIGCTKEELVIYSSKYYRFGCMCNHCKQFIEDISYHCKLCGYDLCAKCHVPDNKTIKDNNGHIINAYYAPWRKWNCCECKQRFRKRELVYYCNLCDYGACGQCFNQKLCTAGEKGEERERGEEGERGEEEEKQPGSMECSEKKTDCQTILNYLQENLEFDELWKRFDRDGNGYIDDDELEQILYTVLITFGQEFEPNFVEPSELECKDIINSIKKEVKEEIDTNDDGVISKKEFKFYAIIIKQEYDELRRQYMNDSNNDNNNKNNNNNNNDEDRIDIKRSMKRGVNSGVQETVKTAVIGELVSKGIGLIGLWLGSLNS